MSDVKLYRAWQDVSALPADAHLSTLIMENGRDLIDVITIKRRSWKDADKLEVLVEATSRKEAHEKAQVLFDTYAQAKRTTAKGTEGSA